MQTLESHYRDVRQSSGYDPIEFDLGELPASYLRHKFAAVDGLETVANATDDATIVTTGVGMTGPPHLGTLGQILTAIELQEQGVDVQLVVADLEVYHGGGHLDRVTSLADSYREFILDLGFDADRGRLRTQEESLDVMHSGHLLARYYDPDDGGYFPDHEPTEWEQAVSEAYDQIDPEDDVTGPTSDAAGTYSIVLHLTDFLHPLLKQDYERVVVMLGIDEHGLTVGTRNFLRDTDIDGTVGGLHTRMIPGTGEYPKMSKSLPDSVIDVTMDRETIRRRIVSFEDEYDRPTESAVFQMMALASKYSLETIESMRERCAEGGETWKRAQGEYADHVADLTEKWE
jgi:tryptophanyl-tRNA synthetase